MAQVYLSAQAAADRLRLDAMQDRKLLALAKALRQDTTLGDQVKRSRIPKGLRRDYDCDNLWRLELPGAWRVLYTILSKPDEEPVVSILRILPHKQYDRLFGYSTS